MPTEASAASAAPLRVITPWRYNSTTMPTSSGETISSPIWASFIGTVASVESVGGSGAIWMLRAWRTGSLDRRQKQLDFIGFGRTSDGGHAGPRYRRRQVIAPNRASMKGDGAGMVLMGAAATCP